MISISNPNDSVWSVRPEHLATAGRPGRRHITQAMLSINNRIRLLWEQHGAWTRMTIVAIVFNTPDVQFVINRLLRNPVDFANEFRRYYGNAIASRFQKLLTEHLTIAAELVQAAVDGDAERLADAEKRWYRNAKEIAEFLGRINPFWSEREWRKMMFEHLRLVQEEAVTLIQGRYQASIDAYDEMERQILEMADVMWQGIVRQFANKFR